MSPSAAVPRSEDRPRVMLPKCPTGIGGFDEITEGGLPAGRPSLVCGPAGCGKSLFALQFLVNGATRYDEPGVFVAFEESRADLAANVGSLGIDIDELERDGRLLVDSVILDPGTIIETGGFDLEALMVRLAYAVDKIGAKRVALDTVETLFTTFSSSPGLVRSELGRLFRWFKEQGLTAVITGERGDGTLTRYGIEEYVSDCVVVLDHRVVQEVSTRRMRVLKYRGSLHGSNEYPFLIGVDGLQVLPITSLGLQQQVSAERVSTGIAGLDEMLGGLGVFRGSSVLISGTSGTCKTTLGANFADAACRRGERVVFFSFEESPAQLLRNMASVGLDLGRWVEQGLLHLHCQRPTTLGLETHLATMQHLIQEVAPAVVVIDPVSSMARSGSGLDAAAMLMRQVDYLKAGGITAVFTSLVASGNGLEETDQGISSLVDTWLLVRTLIGNGERNRGLYVLKSRGMAHSNQIREFLVSSSGVSLVPAYVGPMGVLTGSARATQEAATKAAALTA
ncbi:MAG TPA: circadian clock protein KaiC, partial [Dermatophilaceae bacterium]|nr:circadian clock protein KaiC [Dermatophilaceae bacterium]